MFLIELGVEVEDRITGFKGRVTGRTDYITGCNSYLVQPRQKSDGTFVEGKWIDEHRLLVVDARALVLEPPVAASPLRAVGGDMPAPIR